MNVLTAIVALVIILVGAGTLVLLGVKLGASIYYQGSIKLPPAKFPIGDTRAKEGEDKDEDEDAPSVFDPFDE